MFKGKDHAIWPGAKSPNRLNLWDMILHHL